MKVFYTAAFSGKQEYQQYYDLVLRAIESCGVEVVSPELGNYLQLVGIQNASTSDKEIHYKAIRKGILWSDLVIIEISHESFQLGHEATLAIQNKKPVLCLSIHEDFGVKIKHPFFYGAKYTKYNIREKVREFIWKHRKENHSERFNMFMSKRQLHYLEQAAKESKISVSEYIRSLVDKDRDSL